MFKRKFFLIFIFTLGCILHAEAQLLAPKKEKKDSISTDSTSTDSPPTDIYQNIYDYTRGTSFNRLWYRLIFRKPNNNDTAKVKPKAVEPDNSKAYQGKVIRNIIIVTQAPFDVPVDVDSLRFFEEENLGRFANYIHVNTRKYTVRNLLLFKKNDKFDVMKVQESERLIRSQRYIERGSILAVPTSSSDSVDIIVRVRDAFSIYPEAQVSSSKFALGLKEINFMGLGHQAHINYSWKYSGGINNYQYDYTIPNIKNTYISTEFLYKNNHEDSTKVRRFSFERPFYSSLSRWAGGVILTQQAKNVTIDFPGLENPVRQTIEYDEQDFWAGYALKLKSKDYEKSNTRNIVFSSRYYRVDFSESPAVEYDPTSYYTNENLYLFGIGFSERKYKKDQYIFKYGFVEDVPVGQSYDLIGGIQHKNQRDRFYLGLRMARGGYFKFGYWSAALEYGSFVRGFDIEEGVITTTFNYFTPVIEFGGWKMRQFIKPQFMFGINRLETDKIYLNSYFGIESFNSEVWGKRKFVCDFQTQFFPPWNIWGFKVGPYLLYSIGVLGKERGESKTGVYSLLGLGFLIRNDHLVFNSFEFSISFFPYIPGNGDNVFKFNTYSARDFELNDFDIQKPAMVVYQ